MSTFTSLPRLKTEPPPFRPPAEEQVGDELHADELSWWEAWLEEAPAWLVSVLVHMGLVVVLGLCALGVQQHLSESMDVQLAPVPNLSSDTLDELLGSDLDEGASGLLAEEFDTTLPPTPIVAELPTDSHEAIAGLNGEWKPLPVSADGNPALMSGLGDGMGGGLLTHLGGKGNGGEGNGESGGTGRSLPDTTSFFGLAGEGNKFVYVLDRSDSMNVVISRHSEQTQLGSIIPLYAAKIELKRSLSTLSESSRFQIVFYNTQTRHFRPGKTYHKLYPATKEYKQAAYNFIDYTRGLGGTDHKIALEAAVDFDPDVMFLLTDGREENDLPFDVVNRVINYCDDHHIVLNVVHFSSKPRPECTLIDMAEGTGGKHIFIDLATYQLFDVPGVANAPAGGN